MAFIKKTAIGRGSAEAVAVAMEAVLKLTASKTLTGRDISSVKIVETKLYLGIGTSYCWRRLLFESNDITSNTTQQWKTQYCSII